MSDYLTNKTHACMWGLTGSGEGHGGKSVVANWWSHQAVEMGWFDWAIYFNAKGSPFVRGKTARNYQEAANHMSMGNSMIDLQPDTVTGEDEHADLMDFCRSLDGSKIVIHDEAPDYDDEGGSLHWAVKRGGNEANMKSICISQSPVDLETHIRKQCPLRIWVGPVGDDDRHYFDQLNASHVFDHIREHHEPYQWTVFDMAGKIVDYNEPVPASYS